MRALSLVCALSGLARAMALSVFTAAAIGMLYKENDAISGAEVGCQGAVGMACLMAAGALAEVMGGTPRQVKRPCARQAPT